MTTSRQELYAAGLPFGDSATRTKPGGRIYGGGGGGNNSSGGGGSTSVTSQSLPAELKPLATAYADKAMALGNTGFTPYYGQRNANLNLTQNLGLGMTQDRALNGDPTLNAGAGSLQRQLSSSPTGATNNPYAQQGNPYLDAMVNKAQASVLGNAQQAAVRSGSFGNSGIAEQAASKMGEVATNMYGGAYNQQAQLAESGAGRNDQALQNFAGNNLNASNQALQYGNQGYQDANQMMKAGQVMQDQKQNNLDFDYQQFTDAQNLPYKQLGAMSGVFGSNMGSSSSTTSTPTQSSRGGK